VYLRGEAYLALRDGNPAAAEFQKFVNHRGVVINFAWGALARLGLARAYSLRHRQSLQRVSGFPFAVRGFRHSDPEGSKGRVREAAIGAGYPASASAGIDHVARTRY